MPCRGRIDLPIVAVPKQQLPCRSGANVRRGWSERKKKLHSAKRFSSGSQSSPSELLPVLLLPRIFPAVNQPSRVNTILLAVLALFVIGVVAYLASGVLLPFVLSIFVALIFKPIMLSLQRAGVPKIIALLVVFALVATILSGIAYLIYISGEHVVAKLPEYQDRINRLSGDFQVLMHDLSVQMSANGKAVKLADLIDFSTITDWATASVTQLVEFLTGLFLLLLFTFFMLAGSGDLAAKVTRAFSPHDAHRIAGVIDNIDRRVRQYLVTKTAISLVTGTLAWLILTIFNVDFPLFWGLLTFLLNYIPNFGSMIATLLPVSLAMLQFGSFGEPLAVFVLLTVMQVVMGNIVEPKVMQFSLDLSPVVILVALIFWGWLWGVVGMILAVPITSVIKIIFEHIEPMRPLAVLMSGRSVKSAG